MNAAIAESLKHLGLEPWHDGRSILDGKRPEEQHVMMIVSSLKAERDALLLQVRDIRNVVYLAVDDLVAAQELGVTSTRVMRAIRGLKEVLSIPEKPKGVCTNDCLDKDYSTGHTLCMKELPCPDHDAKKPFDDMRPIKLPDPPGTIPFVGGRVHPYTCGRCGDVIRTDVCAPCAVYGAAEKRKCVCGCHVGGVGSATACGCCIYPMDLRAKA